MKWVLFTGFRLVVFTDAGNNPLAGRVPTKTGVDWGGENWGLGMEFWDFVFVNHEVVDPVTRGSGGVRPSPFESCDNKRQ